ncbi:MAG: hypothetical protein IGS03_10670 [Candidatus Sericytochromatia bacterium]|nr:hypothetical protein [Candidatus Sericytochromatia bacterium]
MSKIAFNSWLLLALGFCGGCGPQVTPPTTAPTAQPSQQAPMPSSPGEPEQTPSPAASAVPDDGTRPEAADRAARLELNARRRIFNATGQEEQLELQAYNSQGELLPLSALQLRWSSSRPEDIAISPAGLARILTDIGFSTIRVEDSRSGLHAEILLSVASSSIGGSSSSGSGSGGGGSTRPATAILNPTLNFEGLEEDPS